MTDWIPERTRQRLADERSAKVVAQTSDLAMFAPHNGTETSKAAAKRVAPKAAGYRLQMLDALNQVGGMTRAEIVAFTGLLENTVNGRSAEILEAKWAREDGVRDGRKVLWITDLDLENRSGP